MMMGSSFIPPLPPNVVFAGFSTKSTIAVTHPDTLQCRLLNFVKKQISLHESPLTLKAPITTIVVCVADYFKSHCCKQCGSRSDCSFRSSLIWVHTVCLYAKCKFEKFARRCSRWHKQTTFSDGDFLGALRVNASIHRKTVEVINIFVAIGTLQTTLGCIPRKDKQFNTKQESGDRLANVRSVLLIFKLLIKGT